MVETNVSEANLEKMRARIKELVDREFLTPVELKEFVYLLWDTESGCPGLYSINDWKFGKEGKRVSFSLEQPEDNYLEITFLDGLAEDSGELIFLTERTGDHGLEWHIAERKSYYSSFRGRRVFTHNSAYFEAEEYLTLEENARVAKLVYAALKE